MCLTRQFKQRCYLQWGQTHHPYCFKCKERCQTVSTNGEGAFHEKCNNEVSGERRALTQLATSKDQSNICRSGAARYCATVFRNNLTAILFCTICEHRSQVKGCILRFNFTTQLQHISRVVHFLGWKHSGCFHKSLLYCNLPCLVFCLTHFISQWCFSFPTFAAFWCIFTSF